MKNLKTVALSLSAALILGVAGCSDEASVQKETTITGPEGTSTVTSETTVESTGENPPIPVDPN